MQNIRHRRQCEPRRRHDARGFTLVEMLVAIVVLTVGVLGLAGTSALITRQIGGGAVQSRAATIAASRFELLHASDCRNLASGTATARGITESWTVSNETRRVRVSTTVTLPTVRGARTQTFQSTIPCPALP